MDIYINSKYNQSHVGQELIEILQSLSKKSFIFCQKLG